MSGCGVPSSSLGCGVCTPPGPSRLTLTPALPACSQQGCGTHRGGAACSGEPAGAELVWGLARASAHTLGVAK